MQDSFLILKTPRMQRKVTKIEVKDFIRKFVNGQKSMPLPLILEEEDFKRFSIYFAKVPMSPDFLTPAEIDDVNISWRQIEEGQAKEFRSVDEFLEELKT